MRIGTRYYSESNPTETYYSVTLTSFEYALFSEYSEFHKRDNHTVPLENVGSNRGLGRSLIIGALGGNALGAAAGGYVGKLAANDADAAGLSNHEIIKKAQTAGGLTGAATGIARGAIGGNLKKAGVGALAGGIGGFMGARKNTKARLRKRGRQER